MSRRTCQRGLSLVVALIMLIVMTVTTLAVFRMSQTGSQIVANMQFRDEAVASANSTIQEVISTQRMFLSPDAVFLQACNGSFNRRCFDLNGDGQDDIEVEIAAPRCVQVSIIPTSTLNLAVAGELACARDTVQMFGVEGIATGDSLCANSTWEIRAQAQDFNGSGATGARMSVVEGVGVQVPSGTAIGFCLGSGGGS